MGLVCIQNSCLLVYSKSQKVSASYCLPFQHSRGKNQPVGGFPPGLFRVKETHILCKYQFGFRENHSTSHTLTDAVEYIYRSLDDNKFVFGVYIDLKKAFDTVDHDIPPAKLEHYGIRGNALKWFESYL